MATIEQQINDGLLKWGQGVDPTDIASANKYIKFKLLEYEHYKIKDSELWEQFKEDFTGFDEEILKACHQIPICNLRTLLRDRGIWVLRLKGTTVAKSLSNTIKEEDQIQ